ncbi:TIGR03986 family type III CRISPR-associated RAMP protein [Pseudoalteromonas sp. T1lg65]|uniref:TIGR03986 family type III CRISPR-associated RAMP protein n=1 Tax=Pseudoalteromonas sp. T1lg65 TaxID=2077101 RepID=UPI003F7981D4
MNYKPNKNNQNFNKRRHNSDNVDTSDTKPKNPKTIEDFTGTTNQPPYHFVHNNVKKSKAVERVDHNTYHPERSGALKIEMTTLTDAIFGCYQKTVKEKSDELFPAFFNERGIIQGSSILGMLRHIVGALSQSPMRHVQEQTFSYRPSVANAPKKPHLTTLPAEVIKLNPLTVRVINERHACLFVSEKAKRLIDSNCDTNSPAPFSIQHIKDLRIKEKIIKNRNTQRKTTISRSLYKSDELKSSENVRCLAKSQTGYRNASGKFYLRKYKGAIDEQGLLSKEFGKNDNAPYCALLIHQNALKNAKREEIQHLVDHYQLTTEHLQDQRQGHISSRHPLLPDGKNLPQLIENNRKYELNQMVFVEALISDDNKIQEIVSFGNNYLYRWRYQNSIHKRLELDQKQEKLIQRQQINLHSNYQSLNLVDRLFGYVNEACEDENKNENNKLAGSLSINHALEVPDKQGRFYKQRHNTEKLKVALIPLGQPKPSAGEFYLKPLKNNKLVPNYGYSKSENLHYELNGRKFYLHQKPYTPKDEENNNETKQNADNKLATTAQYVTPENTRYRMTLRYKNLAPEELGLVVLALQPEIIKSCDIPPQHRQALAPFKKSPLLLANKLGYARPLGYGSVAFDIKDTNQQMLTNAVTAFLHTQNSVEHIKQWLTICLYSLDTNYSYPGQTNFRGDKIYKFHSWIRNTELRRRRAHYTLGTKGDSPEENQEKLGEQILKPLKGIE